MRRNAKLGFSQNSKYTLVGTRASGAVRPIRDRYETRLQRSKSLNTLPKLLSRRRIAGREELE